MILRQALKEQYHAGLAMLTQCVVKCPDDLWNAGTFPRTFWRIAFHAAYFTQLYLGKNVDTFEPWSGNRDHSPELWQLEPYELPEDFEPYTKQKLLSYIEYVDALIDSTVDTLDLDALDCGFPWYGNISKLSHQIMNVRHIQGHVGQLSELLMLHGIDIDWRGKVR